jgi:hypothetical protein
LPLIECPDCGRQVSDAAAACIGCGRPLSVSPAAESAAAAGSRAEVSEWTCDRCGGVSFRKFSVLYEENRGVVSTKTRAVGAGLSTTGSIGIGIGGAKSSGTSVSDLARRLAPPNKNDMAKDDPMILLILGAAGLVGAIAYSVSGFWWALAWFFAAAVVGTFVSATKSAPELSARYNREYEEWDRKFMCLQCGATKVQSIDEYRRVSRLTSTDPEFDQLVKRGETIQAVRLLTKRNGMSFTDAMEAVERRKKQLSDLA